MNSANYKPYHQLPQILYLFAQMLSLGTFISFFLITFLTFETELFEQRLMVYLKEMWIVIIIGLGGISGLIITHYKGKQTGSTFLSRLNSETRFYLIFFSGLLLIAILRQAGFRLFYFDFLLFLFSVYYLIRLARIYTYEKFRPSWEHPATAGGIMQGTLNLGIVFALWEFPEPDLQRLLYILLLIILLIESLTLWSRFAYLSKASPVTRTSLRMMLGSHLALFGVRFIFGLMMPLVYLIWLRFISTTLPYHPLILMIFIGEISERILFFITSTESPVASQASSTNASKTEGE
jgi:hypothetical protein